MLIQLVMNPMVGKKQLKQIQVHPKTNLDTQNGLEMVTPLYMAIFWCLHYKFLTLKTMDWKKWCGFFWGTHLRRQKFKAL